MSVEIETQLKGFKDDIVQTMKLAGIYDFLSESRKDATTDQYKVDSCRVYQTECTVETFETDLNSVEELFEDLADNISVWFEDSSDIAAFLIACFTNKLGILVSSSVGLKVAMAYSILVDENMPLQIEITQDKKSIFEAADIINSSNIRTIYIEGIIDSFRESAVGTLMRLCSGKNLFFSVGDTGTLSLMSNALFDNVMWLGIEQALKVIPDDENGMNSSLLDVAIVVDSDKEEIKKLYKRYLSKLCSEQIIKKPQASQIACVMQVYYTLYQDKLLGNCMKESIRKICNDDPSATEMIEEVLSLQKK